MTPSTFARPPPPKGYGMLGLTGMFSTPKVSAAEALTCLHTAIHDGGCTVLNGAEFYGTPTHNSLTLLRSYFAAHPDDVSRVTVCIKGCLLPPGPDGALRVDGSRAGVRRSAEACAAALGPGKKVDVFAPARRDRGVRWRETLEGLRGVVEDGVAAGVGLSEVSAASIAEAVEVLRPVGGVKAVEVELSLWETGPLRNGVAEVCAREGIELHAYSPIGRGFLTGQIRRWEDLPEGDWRRGLPRFQPGNFEQNLKLVAEVERMAARKGCTPAQLALGWLRTLARRPDMPVIVPIPGATAVERVLENAVEVWLDEEEMREIEEILKRCEVRGDRYGQDAMKLLDE